MMRKVPSSEEESRTQKHKPWLMKTCPVAPCSAETGGGHSECSRLRKQGWEDKWAGGTSPAGAGQVLFQVLQKHPLFQLVEVNLHQLHKGLWGLLKGIQETGFLTLLWSKIKLKPRRLESRFESQLISLLPAFSVSPESTSFSPSTETALQAPSLALN